MKQLISHSSEETERIAEQFAKKLRPGDVVAYEGGLGAGKTAFTRGLAQGLGIREEVSSWCMNTGDPLSYTTLTCTGWRHMMTCTLQDSLII